MDGIIQNNVLTLGRWIYHVQQLELVCWKLFFTGASVVVIFQHTLQIANVCHTWEALTGGVAQDGVKQRGTRKVVSSVKMTGGGSGPGTCF